MKAGIAAGILLTVNILIWLFERKKKKTVQSPVQTEHNDPSNEKAIEESKIKPEETEIIQNSVKILNKVQLTKNTIELHLQANHKLSFVS